MSKEREKKHKSLQNSGISEEEVIKMQAELFAAARERMNMQASAAPEPSG